VELFGGNSASVEKKTAILKKMNGIRTHLAQRMFTWKTQKKKIMVASAKYCGCKYPFTPVFFNPFL